MTATSPPITPSAPSAEPVATTKRTAAGFTLLAATQLLLILAIAIVIVPMTILATDTGYTRTDLALITSGYGLVFSGLLLFGSRLGDTIGRRRALTIGLAGFAVASLVGAFAQGYPMMVAARLLQGGGAALAAPAAMAMVGPLYPDPSRRNKALAVYGIMGSIGGAGGILASGTIATWLSWRWAFAAPAIVAAGIAVAAPRLLPSMPRYARGRIDVPGAALATLSLLGIGYGLMRAGESSFAAPDAYLPLAIGVVGLTGFGIVETRVPDPLLPLRFLRSLTRATAWTALLLITAANAVSTFVLSLYFQQVRGYSPGRIAVAFLPFLLVLFTGFISSRLIGRLGPGRVGAIGMLTTAAGLGLIATLTADGSTEPLVMLGMSIMPIGVGLTFSGTTVSALADVPPHQAGLAGGVVNTAIETGAAGGIAVLTAVIGGYTASLAADGVSSTVAAARGYGFGFGVLAVALVLGAIGSWVVLGRRR